jgi:Eukaryotic aspartyl protease
VHVSGARIHVGSLALAHQCTLLSVTIAIVTLADDLVVTAQPFAEMEDARGFGWSYALVPWDGYLGLGFTSRSVDNVVSVFENAIDQNLVDQPIFSLYLGSPDDTEGYSNGELMFGGYDSSKFEGKLQTVPLASTEDWLLQLDSVSAGDLYSKTMATNSSAHAKFYSFALLDSSTAAIIGPADDVQELAYSLGSKSTFLGMYYKLDCATVDDLPDVVFTMNGVALSFPVSSLMLRAFGMCLLAIAGIDLPLVPAPTWILGTMFLRRYYTVFNYLDQSVSFAKAI